MKNLLNRIYPNKIRGFTLIEVVVNLSVMMIVIIVSGSMLVSGMNIFFKNAETLEQKNIADGAVRLISDNLVYAVSVDSFNDDENVTAFSLSDDGELMIKYNGEKVFRNAFGEEFYNVYSIGYSVEIKENHTAVINVYVYDKYDEEEVFSCEKSVILLNRPDVKVFSYENSPLYIT